MISNHHQDLHQIHKMRACLDYCSWCVSYICMLLYRQGHLNCKSSCLSSRTFEVHIQYVSSKLVEVAGGFVIKWGKAQSTQFSNHTLWKIEDFVLHTWDWKFNTAHVDGSKRLFFVSGKTSDNVLHQKFLGISWQ